MTNRPAIKESLLSIAFVLCTCIAYSKTVAESNARLAACGFFAQHGKDVIATDLMTEQVKYSYPDGAPVVAYYIFNIRSGGFIIISGDDAGEPVLGYADEGTFTNANMGGGLQYLMAGYEQQITALSARKAIASKAVNKKWIDLLHASANTAAKTTYAAVAPLMSTKWNQPMPFNELCPYDLLARKHTMAGCVATAMAQLMKYWNWPSSGCGSHTYHHLFFGPLGVNFNASVYDWGNMPDSPTTSSPAIAKLMYDAGIAVNTDYGLEGSIAYAVPEEFSTTNVAAYALGTYFHYKPSLKALSRSGGYFADSIGDEQWKSMIRAELDAGRPVLYGAYQVTSGMPHCWVCDGYGGNEFFHFNWGWGGSHNGYFRLDEAYASFTANQHAVFGIMPDTYPAYIGDIQLQTTLNTSSAPMAYGQPLTVSAKIVNKKAKTFTGTFCAIVADSTGHEQGRLPLANVVSLEPGDSSELLTFATKGLYAIGSGIYNVHIAYQDAGTAEWLPVANNGALMNYAVIGVSNDTSMLLYKPMEQLTDSLVHGRAATFNTYIANVGPSRFTGSVDLSLYDVTDGHKVCPIAKQKQVLISSYSYRSLKFSTNELRVPPGKYILMLSHQYDDSGAYRPTGSQWQPNPILVTVGGIANYDSTVVYVYPNPAKNVINIDPYYLKLQQVSITDMSGRVWLYRQDLPQNTVVSLQVAALPTGMYVLKCQTERGMQVQKIIIEN